MARILFLLAWLALVVGLVLPPILPEVTNTISVVLMVLSLGLLAVAAWRKEPLGQTAYWVSLVAGLLLMLALIPTARSPLDVVLVLTLAPLWLIWPYSVLLHRLGNRLTPHLIGLLALGGTAISTAVCAYDFFVLGARRGGGIVLNPVHMGDVALSLGFVALVGCFGTLRLRPLYLLGPVLALVSIWLTGSRGPLMAYGALIIVALTSVALTMLPLRHALFVALGAALICVTAAVVGFSLGWFNEFRGIDQIGTFLATGRFTESSINRRLGMYISSWNAFLASPIYGHGFFDFVGAAIRYAPEGVKFPHYDHLHADLANFMAIGGLMGLACYGLMLAAPIVGALSVRGPHRSAALYLAATVSVGYAVAGLTNATFGILVLTVLYAVVTALILALDQRPVTDRT
ncbi:O-antigen ligase family protein [Devosia sp. 2618]|uniref:O-antigen ligase family protein n=1 Tax=Devosia sp. 2618 TaxID=3156454 RepID=UPI00339B3643